MRLFIKSYLVLIFAVVFSAPSQAAQAFVCGDAEVRIEVVARDSLISSERAEAVVTVSLRGVETILRYRSVDHVGGQCLTDNIPRPLVIFQAFCGGSGCRDLDNWGLVDPETLRVLAVPQDSNRTEVQKLISASSLPTLKLMNVVGEAEKQGVQVP
jgi:hypothetical protein